MWRSLIFRCFPLCSSADRFLGDALQAQPDPVRASLCPGAPPDVTGAGVFGDGLGAVAGAHPRRLGHPAGRPTGGLSRCRRLPLHPPKCLRGAHNLPQGWQASTSFPFTPPPQGLDGWSPSASSGAVGLGSFKWCWVDWGTIKWWSYSLVTPQRYGNRPPTTRESYLWMVLLINGRVIYAGLFEVVTDLFILTGWWSKSFY